MNDLFVALGIASWKPLVSAIVAPPLPMILLMILGARLITKHKRAGWPLLLVGGTTLWLSMTPAIGTLLAHALLGTPAPLTDVDIDALSSRRDTAIVVLGRGRRAFAAEYGDAALTPGSLARLQYGIWLSRKTNLPLAFSGGVGWRAKSGPAEADIAARVAMHEFGVQLSWLENQSRDTRENAVNTVALLERDSIRDVVLVTDQTDMPRALRDFERAGNAADLVVVPAPMNVRADADASGLMRWLPSPDGYQLVYSVIHECVGLLAGA